MTAEERGRARIRALVGRIADWTIGTRVVRTGPLLAWLMLGAVVHSTPARADMGTAWVVATTTNSITINWSDPTGKHRSCGSAPHYYVCVKEAGSFAKACNVSGTPTDLRPYTITGLSPGVSYKIKVYTKAEKQNWRGKWKNCELRKVGVLTQATRYLIPQPHLLAVSATDNAITVHLDVPSAAMYDSMHIAYKKEWAPISLAARCTDPVPFDPPARTALRGYVSIAPVPTSIDVEFSDLSSCRRYKFVACLYIGGAPILVNSVKDATSGSCGLFKTNALMALGLEDDHEATGLDYLSAVNAAYGAGTLAHLRSTYPEVAADSAYLAADGEDLNDDTDLLGYLLDQRPDVFDQWQREPAIKEDLSASGWLSNNDPALYAALLDERDVLQSVPGPGPLATAALALGLLLGGVTEILRRRSLAIRRRTAAKND